jgi:hypothetical protein
VHQQGLQKVVDLAIRERKSFGEDPRGGPWAPVLRRDTTFAEAYVNQEVGRYELLVSAMGRTLFDRDTAPGAEPEDMLRLDTRALVVPGCDQAHAISAARYLQECLPKTEYWDVPADGQTEETAPARILTFLGSTV